MHEKKTKPLPLPAILSAALIIAFLVFFAFLLQQPAPQAAHGSVELFLDARLPVIEGSSYNVRAFSSCGPVEISLDGQQIASGGARAEAEISPSAGSHALVAASGPCRDSVEFTAFEKQCEGGESQACIVSGCGGSRQCLGGIWGQCVLPKKICKAGDRVGCSLDACSFGYATCNECGTGYSPCKADPLEPQTSGSLVCPPKN